MASKRGPRASTPRDIEIGRRIRTRRIEIAMTQTELAKALGLTFQQVQKYEKGANRVSFARMEQIAAALGVPTTFFFQTVGEVQQVDGFLAAALAERDTVELVRAFTAIADRRLRGAVLELARSLAPQTGERATATHHGAIANGRADRRGRAPRLHG
jgi:transcriptional regulator with XRE-family HTH domain